jgi:hypothetical protein
VAATLRGRAILRDWTVEEVALGDDASKVKRSFSLLPLTGTPLISIPATSSCL